MAYAELYATIKNQQLFVSPPRHLEPDIRTRNGRRLRNGSYMMNCSPNNILFLAKNEVRWQDDESRRIADKILIDLEAYRQAVGQVPQVMSGDLDYFKFGYQPKIPLYAHQKRCVNLMMLLKHMGLFMDCGTGKTGTSLAFIEMLQHYAEEPIKALVVGKLMSLFSGWRDDCEKFTHLSCEVLWEPTKSSKETLTKEPVTDPKAYDDILGVNNYVLVNREKGDKCKTKSANVYICRKTGIRIYLASAKHYSPKKHIRYQYSWKELAKPDLNMPAVIDGSMERKTYATTNIKRNNIEDRIRESKAVVHIINHDGARIFEAELIKAKYDVVIIDESTVIKNPQAELLKSMKAIAQSARYRFILTGTPASNGPQDLWAQLYWLDRGITLGDNYKRFLELHFATQNLIFGNPNSPNCKRITKHVPNQHTLEWIKSRLEGRHYRVCLKDCADLPPLTSQIIDVFMTDEQEKAYWEMANWLHTEINGCMVEANIALTKLLKLRQITGGFVLRADKTLALKPNPKLDTLKDLMDPLLDNGEQIVVFAIFQEEIKAIKELYPDAAVVSGTVSDKEKFAGVDNFKSGNSRIVICQPQSAAHALTFVNSRYLIFYSSDYSAELNYQAIKRIERIGQKRSMFVYHLITKCSNGDDCIDRIVYDVVVQKKQNQSFLIDGLSKEKDASEIVTLFKNQMERKSL